MEIIIERKALKMRVLVKTNFIKRLEQFHEVQLPYSIVDEVDEIM